MGVIPKKTTPLTKFIRTGEGVLVFAFNLAMLIIPIVSSSLTPEQAVKWAGIVNGVAVISRTGLKIVAEVSKTTGIEPQPIGDLTPQVITADVGGSATNGGAPEVIDPSDPEEFASTPTDDDDAVEVPPAPVIIPPVIAPPAVVITPPAPVPVPGQTVAVASTDPNVSDEEEFADVPPASDDEDDGIAAKTVSDDDDQTDSLEPVGAGASGAPNPTVINGGEEVS